jgi:dihydroorotate dehydrogenase (fumarate)
MDLTTDYLGLKLKHPVVSSASPFANSIDGVRRLRDAGVSAIVLHSLFEEQLEHETLELDYLTTQGTQSFAEALSYFPEPDHYVLGPEEYLNHIRKAKDAVDIPVIASLNGFTTGGWVEIAKQMEQAGADALELNIYYLPTDPNIPGSDVEKNYVDVVKSVREQVKLPLAIKLGSYFSNVANIAKQMEEAGADGLVLFNRFYQPDFNLDELEVVPHVDLSQSVAMRVPLRWVAILYGRVKTDFAITSGVHTGHDVVKSMLAGANVAMMCSALYQHGLEQVQNVLISMRDWMEEKEYESVSQMRGAMSQKSVAEPAAFERANYMKTLQSFKSVV